MRRALLALLYLTLALVIVSTLQSVLVGLVDKDRYLAQFPGASGPIYYVTLAASFAAGANAIAMGLRIRKAVWLNTFIGLGSVILLWLVGAPPINLAIVAAACAITTGLSLLTWMNPSAPQER